MNTHLLEYVLAIAKEGSQQRAAQNLSVSQPALSQQLRKLEQELEMPLFEKRDRRLCLTEAGKIYVNGAQAVLSIYKQAQRDIERLAVKQKREISLVYNNALMPDIPELLSHFIINHPELFVRTTYGTADVAREYLMNGMADLAILSTAELESSLLDFILLRTSELRLFLPIGHPYAREFQKNGVDPHLLSQDFFILSTPGTMLHQLSEQYFASQQFQPRILCEISGLDTIATMVANHQGLAFLPCESRDPKRFIDLPLNPPFPFHIAAAYRKNTFFSNSMRDLILCLLQHYDNTASASI